MSQQVEIIIKDDWYKTASPQEMRIALMHLQMESADAQFNQLGEKQKEIRSDLFESLADTLGWGE